MPDCSFCGDPQERTFALISANERVSSAAICDRCVLRAADLISEKLTKCRDKLIDSTNEMETIRLVVSLMKAVEAKAAEPSSTEQVDETGASHA